MPEPAERVFLLPGEYLISKKPHIISTLLGSCVAVCLYHPEQKFGGMNHYMLPAGPAGERNGKYGEYSINLILKMMETGAGSLNGVEAAIYGGANVVGAIKKQSQIGDQNIELARRILKAKGVPIKKELVGGSNGLKLLYQNWDNHMDCRQIDKERLAGSMVISDEARLSGLSAEVAHLLQGVGRKAAPAVGRPSPTTTKPPEPPKGAGGPVKVLVVDDSPLVRNLLTKAIDSEPDLKVIGQAEDAYQAREMILERGPDVITLDIIMPKMNGVDFLKRLMVYHPIPVIICSTIAKAGSKTELRADRIGAVDVIDKEALKLYEGMDAVKKVLLPKIRAAARARVFRRNKAEIADI